VIISNQYKFIFIKTRKVAGSTIENFLSNFLNQDDVFISDPRDGLDNLNDKGFKEPHLSVKWVKELWPKEFDSYYKFSIERNPWDKIVSAYNFYKAVGQSKAKGSFEQYVNRHNFPNDWLAYTLDNKIVVDRVLLYEDLDFQFKNLCENLKIPFENNSLDNFNKKTNYRKDKNYRNMYTEKTKKIVSDRYSEIINYFDYQF